MIRSAILAGLALGALGVSPALAYQAQSVKAPSASAHFSDTRMFARLMPGTTSETYHVGAPDQRGPTVVYALPKGRAADHLNMSDDHDNPFMGAAMVKPAKAR